jgi:small subunit ribosomal protein S16
MVVIRLARGGAKHRPFYNIVVAHSRLRRDGRFIERIGFYNPGAATGEEGLRIAHDRLNYWKGVGAQASSTVERLVKKSAASIVPAASAPAAPAAPVAPVAPVAPATPAVTAAPVAPAAVATA